MFHRIQLRTSFEQLQGWANLSSTFDNPIKVFNRSTIRTLHPVLRLRPHTETKELVWMQLGIIPSYAHDERGAELRTEAHAEALSCTSSLRTIFKRRRCIVPATSISEHGHATQGPFSNCSLAPASNQILSIAGIWDRWVDESDQPHETFAIVTGLVALPLRPIFDRLPVIIPETDRERWLHSSAEEKEPLDLLRPLDGAQLRHWTLRPYDELATEVAFDRLSSEQGNNR